MQVFCSAFYIVMSQSLSLASANFTKIQTQSDLKLLMQDHIYFMRYIKYSVLFNWLLALSWNHIISEYIAEKVWLISYQICFMQGTMSAVLQVTLVLGCNIFISVLKEIGPSTLFLWFLIYCIVVWKMLSFLLYNSTETFRLQVVHKLAIMDLGKI